MIPLKFSMEVLPFCKLLRRPLMIFRVLTVLEINANFVTFGPKIRQVFLKDNCPQNGCGCTRCTRSYEAPDLDYSRGWSTRRLMSSKFPIFIFFTPHLQVCKKLNDFTETSKLYNQFSLFYVFQELGTKIERNLGLSGQ